MAQNPLVVLNTLYTQAAAVCVSWYIPALTVPSITRRGVGIKPVQAAPRAQWLVCASTQVDQEYVLLYAICWQIARRFPRTLIFNISICETSRTRLTPTG
jgi:hypothetical protein